ncbi:MAG: cyclodeaminase/cyclohydrolase family protein [Chloroflexaceae bacterium]|nr:cyclodeaminase/cyclohydrolase family protein [Chloroflexaceae bacterium]
MSDTINQQSLQAFLDALASNAPTPGGGSVAALSGAMAAGLLSMVCSLTIGKPQFAEFEEEVRGVHEQSEQLRATFQQLAQDDIEAFAHLAAAYKLPRTTDADAASRKAAIQKVTREAADVPLRTARAAANLLPLCTVLANRCSRLIVSDVGVAALLAHATVRSALLNVDINLSSLEDGIYVRETRAQMEDLTVGLEEETEGVMQMVRSRINQ